MKLAISGKGGTGKSTLAAALSLLMAGKGWRVVAVDADPDGNLAAALGASPEEASRIVPISKQKELIEERTGAKVKQYGQMFKLNPEVSDIAEGYGTNLKGVTLLVLGAIEAGGSGCACPESVLIQALVSDLVLHRKDALVMDMEAGIEHLGTRDRPGSGYAAGDGRAEPAGDRFRAPRGAVGRRDRLARHPICGQQGYQPRRRAIYPRGTARTGHRGSHPLVGGDPHGRTAGASGARPAGQGVAGLL